MLATVVTGKLDTSAFELGLKDLWLNPTRELPVEMQLRVRTCGLVSAILYYTLAECGYDVSFYTSRPDEAYFFGGTTHAIVGLSDTSGTSYIDATYSQFLGLPPLGTGNPEIIACYPEQKILVYDATSTLLVAAEVEGASTAAVQRLHESSTAIPATATINFTKVVNPDSYQIKSPNIGRSDLTSVIDLITPSLAQ